MSTYESGIQLATTHRKVALVALALVVWFAGGGFMSVWIWWDLGLPTWPKVFPVATVMWSLHGVVLALIAVVIARN